MKGLIQAKVDSKGANSRVDCVDADVFLGRLEASRELRREMDVQKLRIRVGVTAIVDGLLKVEIIKIWCSYAER